MGGRHEDGGVWLMGGVGIDGVVRFGLEFVLWG